MIEGSDEEGFAMKRIWLSTAAATALLTSSLGVFAADMRGPTYAQPPMMQLYNWTGFYIGGNLGGAWASGTLTDNFSGASFTGSHSGFIGGGQIGYNWQVAPQYVLGIEGMFDWTSISKSSNAITVFNGNVLQGSANTDSVSTIAARFGYAANNWLYYGKAGGGWVRNGASVTDLTTGASVSSSNTRSGWLLGAGIEYGVTPNWTMKLEYDHLGLDNWTRSSPLFVGDTVTLSRHIDMFTARRRGVAGCNEVQRV
jgi:outer membrane immunogenic protein